MHRSLPAVLAFAAGLAAGWCAMRPAPPATSGSLPAAEAAAAPPPAGDAALAAVHEEIAALERAAAAPAAPAGPSPAALAAEAAGLRAGIAALKDAGDTQGLFRLMQRLAALGEPGFPGAIEIAGLLGEEEGSPLQLHGNDPRFREVFTPGMLALAGWILARPEEAPPWLAGLAMRGLSHAGECDPAPAFLAFLARGGDADNARTAVFFLRGLELPSLAPAFADAVRGQAARPRLAWSLLEDIARLGTPEAIRQIEALAASGDAGVAALGARGLAAVRPPPERAAVTFNADTTTGGAPYGLEWGDVVVSLDSTTLTSVEHLKELYAQAPEGTPQVLTVERGGKLCRMKVTHTKGGGSIETIRDDGRGALDADSGVLR